MKQLITICCVAIWVLLLGSVLAADTSSPIANPAHTGRSVSDFLTPDGRFDLNAVRASGYQGPLDLKGVDVRVDPLSGAPTVSASSLQSPADDPDDIYWDNSISPSIPGVDGTVLCMIVYNGKLIVGGSFAVAGSVSASCIAEWDGTSWSPLGTGVSGDVRALTVYDGKLIAGGYFATAGGVAANGIASWDGSSWSTLGVGIKGGVFALIVYDNKLVVGGAFTTAGGDSANSIASWNGSDWSPLGLGIRRGGDGTSWYPQVSALTIYNGNLIAAGEFWSAGGVSANNVASWDGVSWSPLALGVGDRYYSSIHALAVHDNKLIAGGHFWTEEGGYANGIASWNGASWSILGSGVQGVVSAITVFENKLIAAGRFITAGAESTSRIASWDGAEWSPLGLGVGGYEWCSVNWPLCNYVRVFALTSYGNSLICGGNFTTAGTINVSHLAFWDGTSWSPVGLGMSGNVSALTIYENQLIAGGYFTAGNHENIHSIASWNGASWSPLGAGLNGSVAALIVYDGKLVAGGWFTAAGGDSARSIASWDGTTWSPLGLGVNGVVFALTIYDNKLVVGGRFTIAGGDSANSIASWDGTTWSPLERGMDYTVCALTVYEDKLIAGGEFHQADGVIATHVAAWDGTTWSPLGLGIEGAEDFQVMSVNALAVYDNRLIAVGRFDVAGSMMAYNFAVWDGVDWWSPADWSGVGGRALTVYEGKLIVGWAGGISVWDGTAWSSLGSGVNGGINALTTYDDKLIVGGSFSIAGGKPAASLAAWTKQSARAVSLDIKPGSCPNPLNGTDQTRGKAVLPAAIVGTAELDVHDIDLSTITLNGVSPIRWNYEDVSTPVDKSNDSCTCNEQGPDGILDLSLKFDRNAIEATLVSPPTISQMSSVAGKATPGDIGDVVIADETRSGSMSRDTRIVIVRGQLKDGTPIEGYDCVLFMSKGGATATRLDETPRELQLGTNHPNPFNPTTIIEYSLPASMPVTIEVFNLLGQKVRTLVDETRPAGRHQVEWNGTDNNGMSVSTGVYVYRIQAGDFVETKKMLLLK